MRPILSGDRIEFTDDISTSTSDLTTAKFIINSTLSTPHTKCLVSDIKYFYSKTEMKRCECTKIKYDIIPE